MYADAQTANVTGQMVSFGSSLTNSVGTAADASQNVYVLTSAGVVFKETYSSATNSYTESTLLTTASGSGSGIAVNNAGTTLYVGTGTGNSVVVYSISGTPSITKTFSGTFTGLTFPTVDPSGNVFIADQGTKSVYKETLSGGNYTQTTLSSTGFNVPTGVDLDASNALYVSDSGNNAIYKLSGTNYATKNTLTVPSLNSPKGIALDGTGAIYIETSTTTLKATLSSGTTYTTAVFYGYAGQSVATDTSGNVYLDAATSASGSKIVPYTEFGYVNFGAVRSGSPGTASVVFTITGAGTLGTPTAVTEGLPNLDFTLGTGSSCTGATVTVGQSCTVNVTFTPLGSGSRVGAANLLSSTGTILATALTGGKAGEPVPRTDI
jgi:hypothetical protein